MWLFGRPPHDPEPSGSIYKGRFNYVGGYPGYDKPRSTWSPARVIVTADAVTYRENIRFAWRNVFAIPAGAITRVEHIAWIPPRFRRGETAPDTYRPVGRLAGYPGDIITIEVASNGETYTIGLRTGQEGTAFALYGALHVMLGRQLDADPDRGADGLGTWFTSDGEPESANLLYTSRCIYAGGHPVYGKPGGPLRGSPVYVTRDGVAYREKVSGMWRNLFIIPVRSICRVRHATMIRGGYGYPGVVYRFRLHLVLIEMDYKGRTFVVRFKASSEQAAARLYEALDAMVAQASAA